MQKYSLAIIGAGASGLVAAISAARRGRSVVVCDRLDTAAKKLLASGAGRCNLCNDRLSASEYNPESRELVGSVFARFGREELLEFLKSLGLYVYSQQGRVFPITNQSSSMLAVLLRELKRLNIPLELGFEVADIASGGKGFSLVSRQKKTIRCDSLVIAAGGKSYPALGSNGSCYGFARQFGHRVIDPVPSVVPLEVKDPRCHILQGQKIFVCARAVINGTIQSQAEGELLFTKYGLSGTAILDISREISIALNRHGEKDVRASVDFVPYMQTEALEAELTRRIRADWETGGLLDGILPNKFNRAFADTLAGRVPISIARALKDIRFAIRATRGWNEAEFTAGGVEVTGVRQATLESKHAKGLYFCGEILDVEGRRGGYNLAWAFCSGFVAGLAE